MPDDRKFDPFKPEQPQIPGVRPTRAESRDTDPTIPSSSTPSASRPPYGRVVLLLAVVGVIVLLFLAGGFWFWKARELSNSNARVAAAVDLPKPKTAPFPAISNLPVAPGTIGSTAELVKPWSSKRFLFRSSLSNKPVPAMVVRLPNGQYWGFSLREPFGTCELEYVTNLRKLAADYHFHASHPMVGDPCTHAVYDLAQYGAGAPDGGLVRGAIVHGTGIRPPMAIEIVVQDKRIRAVRME